MNKINSSQENKTRISSSNDVPSLLSRSTLHFKSRFLFPPLPLSSYFPPSLFLHSLSPPQLLVLLLSPFLPIPSP